MKRAVPVVSWSEDQSFRLFESRSTNDEPSALMGNDKRIFRYKCAGERAVEEPEPLDPSSIPSSQNTNSIRLFCSRFIKASNE